MGCRGTSRAEWGWFCSVSPVATGSQMTNRAMASGRLASAFAIGYHCQGQEVHQHRDGGEQQSQPGSPWMRGASL